MSPLRGFVLHAPDDSPFDHNFPDEERDRFELPYEWLERHLPKVYYKEAVPHVMQTNKNYRRIAGRAATKRIAKKRERQTTSSNGRAS